MSDPAQLQQKNDIRKSKTRNTIKEMRVFSNRGRTNITEVTSISGEYCNEEQYRYINNCKTCEQVTDTIFQYFLSTCFFDKNLKINLYLNYVIGRSTGRYIIRSS